MNNQKYNHPKSYTETINGVSFKMIFVEGGDVWIGEDGGEKKRVVVHDFYIGETAVTQELWEVVMGFNPSYFKGFGYPVENISWQDIVGTHKTNKSFLLSLNSIIGGRKDYQLPLLVHWKHAASGGQLSRNCLYSGSNNLKEVGWFAINTDSRTMPVKLKFPNELGLFDMSGNVWEWCFDINKKFGSQFRNVCGGSFQPSAINPINFKQGFSARQQFKDVGFRLFRY